MAIEPIAVVIRNRDCADWAMDVFLLIYIV